MSSQQAQNIVQDLQAQQQNEQEADFITEEDALEVEEVYEADEPMDDEDDEQEREDGQDAGDDNGFTQDGDGAENLLDNGFDDSFAQSTLHDGAVFAVALHPLDPLVAVSGGEDDLGYLWRTDTGERIIELNGHTDSVTSVGFSFNGEMVATGGMDGQVRLWKRKAGSTDYLSWEFLTHLEGPDEVNWIDWHPKGNLLLAGSADGTVWLWNVSSGELMHVLTGHTTPVTCGRFTPDGKKIVTCSEDSMLILWDPRNGSALHKLTAADARFRLDGGINALAINPASTVAIVGGAEGGLRAVNLVQGTVLAQMSGHEDGASIEAVAFSEVPTGVGQAATVTVVVSVGTDGRVCTWEANTFKLRTTGSHEDAVTSLAFSPGTTTFVTGSADKTLKVWDYRRGSCLKTLLGHRDVIHSCAVSKDGTLVVSGAEDGVAKVFRPNEDKPDPLAETEVEMTSA